jgi:hypothetical protein
MDTVRTTMDVVFLECKQGSSGRLCIRRIASDDFGVSLIRGNRDRLTEPGWKERAM